MEIQTTQKYIHTTPRKLRLVADMVRSMKPVEALNVLKFTPKMASGDLSAAIKTALGNAKQAGGDSDRMIFKSIEINEGPKMRRFRAAPRGRVRPYKRRMAHIRIVLSDEVRIQKDSERLRKPEDQKSGVSDKSGISGTQSSSEFSGNAKTNRTRKVAK